MSTEQSKDAAIDSSSEVGKYVPKAFDIWALGITVVIGGQYFSWNFGLVAGFGSFAVATLLIATQYVCLVLCTSEISSALPFAGGAYGLARCTLGFYPGFIVGCCEALEYVIYVSLSVVTLGLMVTNLFNTSPYLQPLYWILFYVSALMIHNQRYGGALFWRFVYVIAIISLSIVLVYGFGTISHTNISRNIPSTNGSYFYGGFATFMKIFPLPAWFYVGIESLPFTCDVVEHPKKAIAQGSISCIITLVATSLLVLFVAVGLPTETLSTDVYPLNQGFAMIFNCSMRVVISLSIPATYGTAFGFIYGYGKIICAMAKSRLLPDVYGKNTNNTPFYAMCLGSVASFGFCILIYLVPSMAAKLYGLCMLSGFVGYFSQCVGYVCIRTKFQSLEREFRSPLGIFGACFTAAVSALGVVSIVAFQNDQQFAIISFLCTCFLFSLYYFFIAKQRQTFSPDEQKIMFVAHVVNFNTKNITRRRNRPRPVNNRGSSSGGGGSWKLNSFSRSGRGSLSSMMSGLLSHHRVLHHESSNGAAGAGAASGVAVASASANACAVPGITVTTTDRERYRTGGAGVGVFTAKDCSGAIGFDDGHLYDHMEDCNDNDDEGEDCDEAASELLIHDAAPVAVTGSSGGAGRSSSESTTAVDSSFFTIINNIRRLPLLSPVASADAYDSNSKSHSYIQNYRNVHNKSESLNISDFQNDSQLGL